MAKKVNRLSDRKVQTTNNPGWYPDGGGLYLQVSPSLTKSWVYRYQTAGREHRHGLGPYPAISLKEARDLAHNCLLLRKQGVDPIRHARQQRAQIALESLKGITFKECAESYIDAHAAGWRNRKHEAQWRNTLTTYAYPFVGSMPVQDVDVDLILKILRPIWYQKTETATRVRQRIENILDWAKARNYRDGENPARWRGHLDKLLPKPSSIHKVQHFEAMPYSDVPAYFQGLRDKLTLASAALRFVILTATRNAEVREARWSEFDLRKRIWTIPEGRIKSKRVHRVPLSKEALAVLKFVEPFRRDDDLVFPGLKKERPISEAALSKLLKESHPDLTVHGFRSTFRDWCAEVTNHPREVAESALAHVLKDKTEAAYQRGDLFEKRRVLMNEWTDYLLSK